jgi:hypothetical protein
MSSEIGKQLTVSELAQLKLPAVVCLQKDGRSLTSTWWVTEVRPDWVVFCAAHVSFLAQRTPEDGVVDDTGTPIRIYEYLGKP